MVVESTQIHRETQSPGEDRTQMKFVVALEDGEDGFIVASCPALPGCYSQGRSREEALVNIKEAIEGFVFSMKKHGEPIPLYTELHEIEIEV